MNLEKSLNPNSPIQWILTRSNKRSIDMSNKLHTMGFDVRAILSPTVPEGQERLRICLHAFNSEQEIAALVKAIATQA